MRRPCGPFVSCHHIDSTPMRGLAGLAPHHPSSLPWRRPDVAALGPGIDVALLIAGCALHGAAYRSLQAMAIGPLVFLAGLLPLLALPGGRLHDLSAYRRMVGVGWFMGGIAAGYAAWLGDPLQLTSDAAGFFQLASRDASQLALSDIVVLSEGAGAVVLWRSVYDAMAAVGFDRERFVGVALNTVFVAWALVVALRACRAMFGDDTVRQSRLVALFAWCGLVWLFAAVHLRDSVVLLAVSLTVWAWLRFLRLGGAWRLLGIALSMLLLAAALAVLRTEFIFVPLVATVAALAAMVTAGRDRVRAGVRWSAVLVLAIGAVGAWSLFGSALQAASAGAETYRELVGGEAGSSSLGAQLVVNQPLPIRLVVGSAYLLVFPIPVWSGLASDSVIHLFKTFNALFFYALVPMLAVSAGRLLGTAHERRPERLFVLYVAALFLGAIAATSLESRHLGSFLLPMFLLALVADPSDPVVRRQHWRATALMLAAMLALHAAWLLLKLLRG